ncbi:hypothetical protein SGFS_090330 [Streptomyces graminofaciens]|uniref:Uncharacterized protein n=1 Tax=Streptomyces graminofaciens TaxID=68212 RepID=A0ABN5VWJ7_9ACTN|nr:hypothetical protein SGFS_090330 [Streptomyces graminofaciens]
MPGAKDEKHGVVSTVSTTRRPARRASREPGRRVRQSCPGVIQGRTDARAARPARQHDPEAGHR